MLVYPYLSFRHSTWFWKKSTLKLHVWHHPPHIVWVSLQPSLVKRGRRPWT